MIPRMLPICRACNDRPEGCWKALECGCKNELDRRFRDFPSCPIKKESWPEIDLRTVEGFIYTAAHRKVQLTETYNLKVICGPKFYGDFRVGVARDWGRILSEAKAPYLLLEDDCIAKRPLGTIYYPPDADMVYLGGGSRGAGRAHRNTEASQAFGYSYEDVDANWMRIWGMLYNHAMLFVSRRALEVVGRAFLAANRPGDQLTAALQHELVTYCLKEPLLIQRGNDQTWNYGPQHVRPEAKRQEVVRQIRQTRRMVLAQ